MWSGCIGGRCPVQAIASGVCLCAVVAVRVSLHSRLSRAAVDLLEKKVI